MKHSMLFIAILSFCIVSSFCGCGPKTDRVLIVYDDYYTLIGEILFTLHGEPINVWAAGNIVIFRTGRTIGNQEGEKGKAYWIKEDFKLEEIGNVNLNKTDKELAKRYGANTDASLKDSTLKLNELYQELVTGVRLR